MCSTDLTRGLCPPTADWAGDLTSGLKAASHMGFTTDRLQSALLCGAGLELT